MSALRPVSDVKNIEDRITSSFPISIGTALALETLFTPVQEPYDKDRVIEEHLEPSKFKIVLFNIDMMIRNLAGSIPKPMFLKTSTKELANTIQDEMSYIKELFKNNSNASTYFYYSDYNKLHQLSKKNIVKLRLPTTEQSQLFNDIHIAVRDKISNIRVYKNYIEDTDIGSDALIFTHIAYDMLSYKKFKSLTLIQSHTGKVIRRKNYSWLYYQMSDEKIDNFPFIEELLYIFGDRNLIHPYVIKMRRRIVEVAKSRKWNSYTTLEKVALDLGIDLTTEEKNQVSFLPFTI